MKNNEKSVLEWIEFAKNAWEKEEQTIKSLLKFLGRTIKLSLKILTPAKIKISAEGGVDDPAETGWLYSSFILLNSYFEGSKKISLDFTPKFEESGWKTRGEIVYSFSIARLLLFVLLILLSFPYIKAFKCWSRNRKYFK